MSRDGHTLGPLGSGLEQEGIGVCLTQQRGLTGFIYDNMRSLLRFPLCLYELSIQAWMDGGEEGWWSLHRFIHTLLLCSLSGQGTAHKKVQSKDWPRQPPGKA